MSSFSIRWGIAGYFALALAGSALAQEGAPVAPAPDGAATAEKPADPAKKYHDLKKSKNRATKTLADRYDVLIGMQDWLDDTGKFTIKARYVEHDPDLKWVKLSTVTGMGDKQVVKESTIELAKLSKASQAKVRQISKLQEKLEELAEKEKTDGGGQGAVAGGAGYGDRGERGGRGEAADHGSRRGSSATAAGSDAPVDRTQWASSFAAFRANFTIVDDANGEKVLDWGELGALKAASEAAVEPAKPAAGGEVAPVTPVTQDASQALAQLGEVSWEAPFVKSKRVKSDVEVEFRLPALPRQLKMRFLVDSKESIRGWTELPPDQPIQFVGRFESVKPREITMRVRKASSPAVTAAPTDAAAPADARTER